jgi:hypothetical protein
MITLMTQAAETLESSCAHDRAARRSHIRRMVTNLGAATSLQRAEEVRRIWQEAANEGR